MSAANTSHPIAFGRLLEQQPDWIWATVESLEATVPVASDPNS